MKIDLQTAINKFQSGGGGDFLTLKNDGDSITGRFIYGNDPNEMDYFVVYEIEVDGKRRMVEQNSEQDPFAMAGFRPKVRALLQFVDATDGAIKFWNRGKKDLEDLIVYMNQYGNLYALPLTIKRSGRPGDKNTIYVKLPGVPDAITPADLPNSLADRMLNKHDGIFLKFTDQEQAQYLANPTMFKLTKTPKAAVQGQYNQPAAQPVQYAQPAPQPAYAQPVPVAQPAPQPVQYAQPVAPVAPVAPVPATPATMVNQAPVAPPVPVAPVAPVQPVAAPVAPVQPIVQPVVATAPVSPAYPQPATTTIF